MNLRIFVLTIFFLVAWCDVSSQIEVQPVYQLSLARESSLLLPGAATLGISFAMASKHPVLTPEQIEDLDIKDICRIDRWAATQYTPRAHQISNGILFSSYLIPPALWLGQSARDEAGRSGLLALEALLLTNGLGNLTKYWVKRPRPYVYNDAVALQKKMNTNSNLSFFSGHTSNVACMYYLGASMFNDFYPDSKARPYVWSVAVIVPAIQGFLRMKAGKHFFTDVLTGYVLGAAVGILVPAIHR